MIKRFVFGVSCVWCGGCAADHVQLHAPSSDAPLEVRREAYVKLRPVLEYADYAVLGSDVVLPPIRLADDTTVIWPEDLLPVVQPDSDAARLINASVEHRQLGNLLVASGGVAIVGGLLLVGHGMSSDSTPTALGGLALTAVGGGVASAGYLEMDRAAQEARYAFGLYDSALQVNLNVCTDGRDVVVCP